MMTDSPSSDSLSAEISQTVPNTANQGMCYIIFFRSRILDLKSFAPSTFGFEDQKHLADLRKDAGSIQVSVPA